MSEFEIVKIESTKHVLWKPEEIVYDTLRALSYKRVVHETQKAWLLEMDNDCHIWWPKQYCTLTDGRETITAQLGLEVPAVQAVIVPNWLYKDKTCYEE